MKRTIFVAFVIGLALGLGGGFLLGNRTGEKQAAINSQQALTSMLPASSMASGMVQGVKDSKVLLDGGWSLAVNRDTDIFIRKQKSTSEFQKDLEAHQKAMLSNPGAMAPLPTKDVAVSVSDIRPGMFANAELAEASKPGEIAADKVRNIVLTESAAPAATPPPPPAP